MRHRIVIVSHKPTKLKTILPKYFYAPIVEYTTISDLKNNLRKQSCDILIIQEPLNSSVGWKLALECKEIYHMEILLIVTKDQYDKVTYQLSDTGIFIISLPYSNDEIFQTMELIRTHLEQVNTYKEEIIRLKTTIKNDRIINRAKLVLIESYHWSEDKAHHYIEKIAMDASVSKLEVAKQLLDGMHK